MNQTRPRWLTLPEGCSFVDDVVLNCRGDAVFILAPSGEEIGPGDLDYQERLLKAVATGAAGPMSHPAARWLAHFTGGTLQTNWELPELPEPEDSFQNEEFHRELLRLARANGFLQATALLAGFCNRTSCPSPEQLPHWRRLVIRSQLTDRQTNMDYADWAVARFMEDYLRLDPMEPYAGERTMEPQSTAVLQGDRKFQSLKEAWQFWLRHFARTPRDMAYPTFVRRLNEVTGRKPGVMGAPVSVCVADVLRVKGGESPEKPRETLRDS